MKTINWFIVALSGTMLFVISSCDRSKQFEKELNTIDSSLAVLDSIDQVYQGIEFDSLILMVDHVKKNEAAMKHYYTSDTINQELGRLMNHCKGVRKSLKDISGRKLAFNDEIFALRKQFGDLKTDILSGALSKEDVDKFLPVELEALEKLTLTFFEFDAIQKEQKAIYYMAVPQVDAYVENLVIPEVESLP